MNILVCVKRVPATGSRITLTDDALHIDTKHLGFTISPHEECAVEEAVQLVEAHGGTSVGAHARTRGRRRAAAAALAIGIERAILLDVGDDDRDAVATADAIVEVVRAEEAAGDRVRPAFVRERVRGFRRLSGRHPGRARARTPRRCGREVARDERRVAHGTPRDRRGGRGVRRPAARSGHRQGGNQPSSVPVGPRPDARPRRRRSRIDPSPTRRPGGLKRIKLKLPPEQGGEVEVSSVMAPRRLLPLSRSSSSLG